MRSVIFFLLHLVAPKNTGRPWSLTASTTPRSLELIGRNNVESGTGKVTDEISPFYRRDTRELDASFIGSMPPLKDPKGLAALLEERYQARQSGEYTIVSKVDRQLKRKHGVKAYDYPPVWTRLLSSHPTSFLRRQAQKQTRMMRKQRMQVQNRGFGRLTKTLEGQARGRIKRNVLREKKDFTA